MPQIAGDEETGPVLPGVPGVALQAVHSFGMGGAQAGPSMRSVTRHAVFTHARVMRDNRRRTGPGPCAGARRGKPGKNDIGGI